MLKKEKITVKGINLVYYTSGKGKPLLFLHGGRVQALTFEKNIELLSKQYSVIAPDIPGYGDSLTPQDIWSFKEYANFFDAFLENKNVTDIILVGYSMGGGIAYNLAAKSKKISHLILIDAAGIEVKIPDKMDDIKRLLFYITHPKYISFFVLLIRDYIRFITKHNFHMKHISRIRAKCAETNPVVSRNITIPTYIFWGKEDWILPLAIGKRLHQKIPHSKFIPVNGNHDWFLYNPKLFMKKLLQYFL